MRQKKPVVFESLSDMLAGFMRTQAMFVAVQLGLPDIVSKTPTDVREIASRAGADESSMYRLLRLLSSEGLFREGKPRKFVETPLSNGLRVDSASGAHWLAVIRGAEFYRVWAEALYSFQTGKPAFERVYGRKLFDYLAQHPERSRIFNHAMAEKTNERLAALVAYDWSSIEHVTDVGGGNGTAIAAVLKSASHLRGSLFDLPSIIDEGEEVLRRVGVRGRCEITGGDFFKDPIPFSDALILSQVLHDWDDEQAHAILVNCRRALAKGGLLLLVEGVIPSGRKPNSLKLLDLNMLVLLGGKERTQSEWRNLLAQARFRFVRILPTGLIEARAA
jgi:SAM-dependent methyltransferase